MILDGIQGTYAIAYADRNGNNFSKTEPWIMAELYTWNYVTRHKIS